jgi:hypothetical protein
MGKFELYGLFCPYTDEIKYIGITKNGLRSRLNQHLNSPTNQFISSWFNDLNSDDKIPVIKLIKECNTYEELLQSEIKEIKKYRKLGFDLYNLADGGDINPMLGKTHTEEARKKISQTHKGRKMSEDQKLKRKTLLKQLWSNPEWAKTVRQKMGYNTKGEKNPNWKGGRSKPICECGNKKSFYSKTCFSCRDISGDKNPFFGKNHSPEIMNKIKETLKQKGGFAGKNNPNFKYDIKKEELYDLYIVQNKTVKEIGSIYNCAINTINKKLRHYNIFKPNSNIYNLNKDKIKELLEHGLNYVQIGKEFGCSNKIIHKYVKTHNIYVK